MRLVEGFGVAVLAVQAIRRMRGGAQSQLMLGADGHLWVVKFQNNPQHLRVLANELIATRLAEAVGLSVPATDVVEVTEWLIAHSPEMMVDRGKGVRERCAAGLQFGSRFIGGLMPGQVLDYVPEDQIAEVRNVEEFAGMLVIDKWTGNANGRQAVFHRRPRERKYRATFIDQGYCFHAGDWTFSDAPLRGVYQRNAVYAGVTGWESFEPWLSRVETMSEDTVFAIAEAVPPEWYGGDPAELEQLMVRLLERRARVRELIVSFRDSDREPFPHWGRKKVVFGKMPEPRFVN
ncbi:MAG: phosphatidylinositol kinase [Acidobacteria bacterium]|nr:phosphatidylinositol kinase [Acidobacteriota bacterium]